MAKENTVTTFKGLLQRANKTIQAERAQRIATSAKMAYDAKVNALIKKIFNLEDELLAMSDLSTSNLTTHENRIKGAIFNSEEFVNKRAQLMFDKTLLEKELKVLKSDEKFYS